MLHLVLAEAELEAVSASDRAATNVPILDAYFHRELLAGLPDHERRGRPDIVHQCLSLCQGSRLGRAGMLRTYVHTREDIVIEVSPLARVPPNQVEFFRLMGRLLDGEEAEGFQVSRMTFRSLMERIAAPLTVAMTPDGEDIRLADVIGGRSNVAVVVGAFPCGDYRGPVYEIADVRVSLGRQLLTVPAVVSEVLCAAKGE